MTLETRENNPVYVEIMEKPNNIFENGKLVRSYPPKFFHGELVMETADSIKIRDIMKGEIEFNKKDCKRITRMNRIETMKLLAKYNNFATAYETERLEKKEKLEKADAKLKEGIDKIRKRFWGG